MAKVKIQGHASGTGIFTLTAPNSNTDRTITLPDGTGTLAFTTGDDDKLPLAGGTMTGNISHASHFTLDVGGNITLDSDNGFVKFADGGTDIGQFAKGSNSNLEIKSLVADADIVFQGNDNSVAITALTLDMSDAGKALFNSDVKIPDTAQFQAGASADLKIHHTSGNSFIEDSGTGQLFIKASAIDFQNPAGTETLAQMVVDGAVNLHHNGSKKLATTSTGINVTGNIAASGTVDGVDIAARDAILTSTTTTAGAALPKAGGTMTGQLTITDGSLSAPAIANTGDLNTGMCFPADETIAFSAGGTQVLKLYADKKVVAGEEGWDISTGLSVGGTDNANIMNIFTPLSSTSTWGGLGFGASNTSKAAIIYQRHSSYSVGSLSICVNADADLTHADLDDKVVNFSNNKDTTFYGRVGIGSVHSAFKLKIDGGNSDEGLIINTGNSSSQWLIRAEDNANNQRFVVKSTGDAFFNGGNVGINQINPARLLDVNGDMNLSGNLYGDNNTELGIYPSYSIKRIRMTQGGEIHFGDTTTSNALGITEGAWDNFGDQDKIGIYCRNELKIYGNTNTCRFTLSGINGRQSYSGATANAHATFVGEVGASYHALDFERTNGGGVVGSVVANASSTSYNTSSDYRLKENVNYTWDATTRLKQLKPARFNWITDDTNTLVDGFIAHEVSNVVPEAISGEKDAVDLDDNPEYQGIDQSKLVPLLVKTIQELEARITVLEA